jgi:hypothetical protein
VSGDWTAFFTAEVGASAALAGLVFIALSINLREIIGNPALVGRAAQALLLLLVLPVGAGLAVLAPYGSQADGIIALVIGAGVALAVNRLLLRATRRSGRPANRTRVPGKYRHWPWCPSSPARSCWCLEATLATVSSASGTWPASGWASSAAGCCWSRSSAESQHLGDEGAERAGSGGRHPADCCGGECGVSMIARRRAGAGQGCCVTSRCLSASHRRAHLRLIEGDLA